MAQHFLFMSLPDHGHIFPNLAVIQELVRRGHRVTFITGAVMAERLEAAGATVLPYESRYAGIDKVDSVNEARGTRMLILAVEEAAEMVRVAEPLIAADRPDVVGYDVATSYAGKVLELKYGLPALQLSPIFVQNESFSFASAFADDDEKLEGDMSDMAAWMAKVVELTTAHGLDVPFDEFFMSVPQLTIVYLPKEFQTGGETFADSYSFVGPCIGDRSFLGQWRPPADGLPVVLVSLGSIFNEYTGFFRTCIEAFAGAPVHVVMTVGAGLDPADLGPLPANVEVHRWVSHLAVLAHAKAFVTHGGMGSVMEALDAAVPMLVVPLGPLDRPTAKRVVELGLGRMLKPATVTADLLRYTLLELLGDESGRDAAAQMQRHVRNAGGTIRAADEIEAFAKRAD